MTGLVGHIDWLGWIVFAIIAGSVVLVVLATAFGKPRNPKVTLTLVGTLLALTVAVVATFWIGGIAFGLVMG